MARQFPVSVRRGAVRKAAICCGSERCGMASWDTERFGSGQKCPVWFGTDWPAGVSQCSIRSGLVRVRLGMMGFSKASYGRIGFGSGQKCPARSGMVRNSSSRQAMVVLGLEWFGPKGRYGLARSGMASHGAAR